MALQAADGGRTRDLKLGKLALYQTDLPLGNDSRPIHAVVVDDGPVRLVERRRLTRTADSASSVGA